LQKNGGPAEIILHFFLCFYGFLGFFLLQAIDFQPQPAIQPLQEKSCQKHYRRFFVRFAMCHNPGMNDEKFATPNAFGAKVKRPAAVKLAKLAWQAAGPPRQQPFDAIGKTLSGCPSHLSHWSPPSFLNDLA